MGVVEERRVYKDVVWSMVSWLSLLPSVECKQWIRAARGDSGEGRLRWQWSPCASSVLCSGFTPG